MHVRVLRHLHGSKGRNQAEVASALLKSVRRRTKERLLWLSRGANGGGLHRCVETMTLGQLEDSRRPLLFSLLPRMLRRDGSTPGSLQRLFGYLDQGRDRSPAIIVSSQRWRRAVATSRKLATGRTRGGKP